MNSTSVLCYPDSESMMPKSTMSVLKVVESNGKVMWEEILNHSMVLVGFPVDSDDKESACNVGDLSSSLWLGKIPHGRKWQPTPVFLPGESLLTEEPGGLQPMGSQGVRPDSVTKHRHSVTGGRTKDCSSWGVGNIYPFKGRAHISGSDFLLDLFPQL